MKKIACIFAISIAGIATCVGDVLLNSATHLAGREPSLQTWLFDEGRTRILSRDGSPVPTIAQAEANTNSAAFVAWCASRPDVLLAAELQQLSASLDALVFLELGEHIDGTDEQLARLSAVAVSSLESHRIKYSKAETLAELKAAGAHINNLRSIISLQAKIVSLQN
tara:strand:- start:25 stop:525 length:501 start_codon:yes stop_codon:yes gene_type:complete